MLQVNCLEKQAISKFKKNKFKTTVLTLAVIQHLFVLWG